MTEPIFDVSHLVRRYRTGRRTVTALDDVSLTVAAGERLGVVGESGSGKSTLVRLLAALDRPTAGTVRFDGRDVVGVRERELGFLRSRVQMVFQDPRGSLDPRMTVGDIVTEPLRARVMRGRVPQNRSVRLREVLDSVGLPADAARRYPHEFSGGQRQRIAIARALAPKPDVLIADEAVSALDVSVRAQVLNLISSLVDENALTLVFVSHDLAVVRHVCSSVLVLRAGRVEERGSIDEVYTRPRSGYTRELLDSVPRLATSRQEPGTGEDA